MKFDMTIHDAKVDVSLTEQELYLLLAGQPVIHEEVGRQRRTVRIEKEDKENVKG